MRPEVLQQCVVATSDARLVQGDLLVEKDFDSITAFEGGLPDDDLPGCRVEVAVFDAAGSANDRDLRPVSVLPVVRHPSGNADWLVEVLLDVRSILAAAGACDDRDQ